MEVEEAVGREVGPEELEATGATASQEVQPRAATAPRVELGLQVVAVEVEAVVKEAREPRRATAETVGTAAQEV